MNKIVQYRADHTWDTLCDIVVIHKAYDVYGTAGTEVMLRTRWLRPVQIPGPDHTGQRNVYCQILLRSRPIRGYSHPSTTLHAYYVDVDVDLLRDLHAIHKLKPTHRALWDQFLQWVKEFQWLEPWTGRSE